MDSQLLPGTVGFPRWLLPCEARTSTPSSPPQSASTKWIRAMEQNQPLLERFLPGSPIPSTSRGWPAATSTFQLCSTWAETSSCGSSSSTCGGGGPSRAQASRARVAGSREESGAGRPRSAASASTCMSNPPPQDSPLLPPNCLARRSTPGLKCTSLVSSCHLARLRPLYFF